VFAKVGKLESEIFDVCLYRENWLNGCYFDDPKEDLSHNMNRENIPFSHPILFLIQDYDQFFKVKNGVLLMPTHQLITK
jgi:hypothetical protein